VRLEMLETKVEWVEREEKLSVICIKMVVKALKGKGRDKSTERGSVHDEE